MSLKKIIRKGDATTHGGIVLEGLDTFPVMGKPASKIGHMVSCPQCKGIFPIVEGVSGFSMFGEGAAVEGMKTSCGAELIASQDVLTLEVFDLLKLTETEIDGFIANADNATLVASLGKDTSWKVLDTEKVYIMVNDNPALLGEPVFGTHAGMMIGESGKYGSMIYDPSGSYDPCRGEEDIYKCDTTKKIGSGRTVNNYDTNYKHYIQYQIDDDGPEVYVFEFNVPVKNIKIIEERIANMSGGGLWQCTKSVSSAITGLVPFGDVWAVRPKELKRILQKLKTPHKGNPF